MITKPHHSDPAFLSLEDVGVEYSTGVRALMPTTLRFQRGECVVLLGRSGAGKSTLLRTINLLVQPTEGRVLLDGRLAGALGLRRHRRRIGMIFQQHQLQSRQSALRNVLNGRIGFRRAINLLPWSAADQRVALSCLQRVGLLERAQARADELSGGQQQRVGVARALAQEPDVLLADEPVASLDPATADSLLQLLRGISRDAGILTLISLHQVELAARYADRVIGLNGGGVVYDGAPTELTADVLERIYGPNPASAQGSRGRSVSTKSTTSPVIPSYASVEKSSV